MTESSGKEWVLPASIPFSSLKAQDLEECVYWLLDAMGAKDLEWRTGGAGQGAADGGRDLEAHFFTSIADGEIERQTWWIECKGRTGTVEADAVKSAVLNAAGKGDLDYIVIATNTQFSNPTIDWVQGWQKQHPKPKVKLWDKVQLERYLSRHPDVVLRLFSEALSLDGRFKAMTSRFWNKIEFVSSRTLADLWDGRESLGLTAGGVFAAIVNEFAHGDITRRPWGAALAPEQALDVLDTGLTNTIYLIVRSVSAGTSQVPIIRAFAYLILVALSTYSAGDVAKVVMSAIGREDKGTIPEEAQELLLGPIANQLLSEMQDVCGSDCPRVMSLRLHTLTKEKEEIEDYWLRLEAEGNRLEKDERVVRIEKIDEPCVVGFPVGKENGCPLYAFGPTVHNVSDLFEIIKKVVTFRRVEAANKRNVSVATIPARRATTRRTRPGKRKTKHAR